MTAGETLLSWIHGCETQGPYQMDADHPNGKRGAACPDLSPSTHRVGPPFLLCIKAPSISPLIMSSRGHTMPAAVVCLNARLVAISQG